MTSEITGRVGQFRQHCAWTACGCTEERKEIPVVLHARITTDVKNICCCVSYIVNSVCIFTLELK